MEKSSPTWTFMAGGAWLSAGLHLQAFLYVPGFLQLFQWIRTPPPPFCPVQPPPHRTKFTLDIFSFAKMYYDHCAEKGIEPNDTLWHWMEVRSRMPTLESASGTSCYTASRWEFTLIWHHISWREQSHSPNRIRIIAESNHMIIMRSASYRQSIIHL